MISLFSIAFATTPEDASETGVEATEPVVETTGPVEEFVIQQEGPVRSAAERTLDAADVVATPGRSTDDLLRATRGLHQSAHGGHGKAFQYFLRGFDAVHGADLSIDLEGVPLNEVSNVHGHGYLDLHFIPRGLIVSANLRPGVADASIGDFGVAGAGSLSLGLANPGLTFELGGGTDRGGRASIAYRPKDRGPGTFLWLDGEGGLGVGDARDWTQFRGGAGFDGELGPWKMRTFLLGYRGDFASPGVVRETDLESGLKGFYDAYQGSGSGISTRLLWGTTAKHSVGGFHIDSTFWAGTRGLELRQNYTGSYEVPEHGDATLQTQSARMAGAQVRVDRELRKGLEASVGADARLDLIRQTEAAIDRSGDIWEERLDTRVDQRSAGVWGRLAATPWDSIAIEGGLRANAFEARLDRSLDGGLGVGKATGRAPVLAPRGQVRFFPKAPVSVFVGGGRGFRSPEARGVEDGRAPVSVSDGGEVSILGRVEDVLELRAGAFGTWISNEIIFDHAAARFLTTGPTRRLGGYAGFTAMLQDTVKLEVDVTVSDGRYTDSEDPIPYAPRGLVVGQLSSKEFVTGPFAWTAGVRSTWLGRRPLPGGFASHASFVTDVTARMQHRSMYVDLDIDNVFASKWRDGEFFYASDWSNDGGAPDAGSVSALPKRHITAGAPFVARLTLGWRL